jgi:hypothetical protein
MIYCLECLSSQFLISIGQHGSRVTVTPDWAISISHFFSPKATHHWRIVWLRKLPADALPGTARVVERRTFSLILARLVPAAHADQRIYGPRNLASMVAGLAVGRNQLLKTNKKKAVLRYRCAQTYRK